MFKSRQQGIVWVANFFLCVLIVCILSVYACYSQNDTVAPGRYRVFSLRNISSEQGKAYINHLNLGTVSALPAPNTLLLTAPSHDLIKATALLKLVDSDELYVIKTLFAASEFQNIPSNVDIANEMGDISIGTFANPPPTTLRNKAIIDLHGDSVIIIAPSRLVNSIISSVAKLQEPVTNATQPGSEPNESNEPAERKVYPAEDASEELFSKLLGSIAKAEKDANEDALVGQDVEKQQTEPAEQKEPEPSPVVKEISPVAKQKPSKDVESPKTSGLDQSVDVNSREYKPEPAAIGNEMLDLDLPEKLNITDLLGLVGEYLELDYMYDPAKVKGDVALRLRGPIKVIELYPLLESVLKFKGFVMTRKGNLVIIVPAAEVLNIDPVLLRNEEDKIEYGDVIVTRIIQLRYIDPDNAKNLLSSMKLGVSISAISETSTLIVTGYAYRMSRIEELLRMVDEPSGRKFLFRQLKYTMAKTLAPKIKTLAEQLGTVSVTIVAPAVPAPARPTRGRRAIPAPSKPSEKPAVYLDADERTNRILMIGSDDQLEIVNGLIDSLDVVQQDLRMMRLYEIQHVGVEDVKDKLQELGVISSGRTTTAGRRAPSSPADRNRPAPGSTTLEAPVEEPQIVIVDATNSLLVNATPEQHIRIATIISYVDSETLELAIPYEIYPLENQDPEALAEVLQKLIQETIKDKEGKIERTVRKIDEEIIIVPDENTFSIIVYASKKNQEWIKKLITTLDKRRPQVLIDVMLVEITKSDVFAYDLDVVSKIPLVGISDPLSLSFVESGIFSSKKAPVYSSIGGTGTGFYADRHIQALLTLMQEKGYGRVLAQPKILVNDNETGTIDKKTTLYVARTSGSTIATSADPITRTSVTFDEFTSGIELDITPHISEGNLLRLEIRMSRSSQVPEGDIAADEPPPDKKEDNIDTIVTVPDKSTIILGGVTQLDQSKSVTKIPGLGDIPIIGGLFRTIDDSDLQTKLYIFVRAHILRPAETSGLPELVEISKRKREIFERAEKEFQEYQDWPGVEPEPMDPIRILEEK